MNYFESDDDSDSMDEDEYDDYDDSHYLSSEYDYDRSDWGNEFSSRTSPPFEGLKHMSRCVGICAKLNEDRKTDSLCNATIVMEGKKFSVHKNILKASSSYFTAMFMGSFSERNEQEIEILGVSPEVFAVVLDYIYGVDVKLTFENVKDLYIAGDMLCIDTLIADCKTYITDNWRSCADLQAVYEMASQFEMKDITAGIVSLVASQFSISLRYMNNRELSHSLLLTVLGGRNSLHQLRYEETVVNNILEWAIQKPQERIPDLVLKLFSVVHFELIAEDSFKEILSFKRIKEGTIPALDLIKIKTTLEALYRQSHQKLIDLGFRLVLPDFTDSTTVHVFDSKCWKWEKVLCTLSRTPQSYVLSDSDLYVFTSDGGTKFNLSSGLNVVLPSFPRRREGSVFSVLNKTVYAIGGTNVFTNKPLGDILTLNPSSNSWSTRKPSRKPNSDASLIVDGPNIYLVGGRRDRKSQIHSDPNSTDCFVYNTQTRYFRMLCTLPFSYKKPKLAIYQGVLYIFTNESVYMASNPRIQAIDLKRRKVITSHIKALDLVYPILSVCSVASGIVIAYSLDNKILLALYTPMGNGPSDILAFVSSFGSDFSQDRQTSNYKLQCYSSK